MLDVCMVFPNRRSGTFFNAYLQKLAEKPVIGPKVTTVSEFIHSFSDTEVPDKIRLIAQLYEVFRSHSATSETFDEYYYWGEVLLADFNDIDLYLADPSVVYKNLAGLKEIEMKFDFLDDTQKEVLRHFWGSLGRWEEFKSQEEFIRLWQLLEPVYFGFREKLKNSGIAYDGMVYREIAEQIKSGATPRLEFEKYYIVGLNALNECEKVVFKFLKKEGKAEFLWDYDQAYLQNLKNKAGDFIRENRVVFPPPDDFKVSDNEFSQPKNIRFVSVASNHGQAQVIPGSVGNLDGSFDNTAIVLADESLLFPVLGAIPETVSSVNITMGYPVKNSSVFGFISLLASLLKNARIKEGKTPSFYYRFVFDILNHQLLGGVEPEAVSRFIEEAKKTNRIYIRPEELGFSDIHCLIFSLPVDVAGYGEYFKAILKSIFTFLRSSQPENKILPELIVSIYGAIEKLESAIAGLEPAIGPPVFFRLFNQYIGQTSVAFEGEPLSGLQVMGILETRCLDFENLIIIGLNEDLWPRSADSVSLIPYNLRFAFGLPSVDQQEAVSAYYFYRLLQRPANITATFNTIKEGINTGELSRFGLQLIYDSGHKVGQTSLDYKIRNNPVKFKPPVADEELSKLLLSRFSANRPLSPSALNIYLSCRYKFYLRYAADLPEGDEIAEDVDSRLFGNIFHKAAQLIYSRADEITAGWLDALISEKKAIDEAIGQAFQSEYFKSKEPFPGKGSLDGHNRLSYEFIRSYLVRLLEVDRQNAPFRIVGLEEKHLWEPEVAINGRTAKIPLGGIIDRIDQNEGKIRVIDYKTGLVDNLSVSTMEAVFNVDIKSRKKEAFQAFLYALILRKTRFTGTEVVPGIYALRNLFNEKFNPYFKLGNAPLDFTAIADEFESRLSALLQEIFSVGTTFSQTTFTERCTNCPYKTICHRT